MAITVGIPRETFPGERRVAITPRACQALQKVGVQEIVEYSAGAQAGFLDDHYLEAGARLASRADLFKEADIIAQVRCLGANPDEGRADLFREADIVAQVRCLGPNPDEGRADLPLLRPGQVLVGFGEPLTAAQE